MNMINMSLHCLQAKRRWMPWPSALCFPNSFALKHSGSEAQGLKRSRLFGGCTSHLVAHLEVCEHLSFVHDFYAFLRWMALVGRLPFATVSSFPASWRSSLPSNTWRCARARPSWHKSLAARRMWHWSFRLYETLNASRTAQLCRSTCLTRRRSIVCPCY